MTTLTELADVIQIHLSDSAADTWSQANIEQWIRDAIKEYSIHFPRVLSATINCQQDIRIYDLPADFYDTLSVEYPAGEDPPRFLRRLTRKHSLFWQSAGFYDLIKTLDDTNRAQMIVSQKPQTGQTIDVWYQAGHQFDLESGDAISVPAEHHHLLIMYVVWLAWRERLAAEEKGPDSITSLLSQYASNTARAWRDYTEALNRAKLVQAPGGFTTRWRVDLNDPIY